MEVRALFGLTCWRHLQLPKLVPSRFLGWSPHWRCANSTGSHALHHHFLNVTRVESESPKIMTRVESFTRVTLSLPYSVLVPNFEAVYIPDPIPEKFGKIQIHSNPSSLQQGWTDFGFSNSSPLPQFYFKTQSKSDKLRVSKSKSGSAVQIRNSINRVLLKENSLLTVK